jgi:hypothetical protein
MSERETVRPFVFSIVEDDGDTVILEVSEEDYRKDLEAGLSEDELLKPGRHKFTRGGFLKRHPELKGKMRKRA